VRHGPPRPGSLVVKNPDVFSHQSARSERVLVEFSEVFHQHSAPWVGP
jgi:hypothetical protein